MDADGEWVVYWQRKRGSKALAAYEAWKNTFYASLARQVAARRPA